MKFAKLLPAAALLILPLAAPVTAYADSSATPVTATAPQTTANNGLYVSGDVVLSGVCQVEGQYRPGQMMVFRAQVLETDGSVISDGSTVTVSANIVGVSTPVQMAYDKATGMWVGTYVIPLTQKPGFLPYTIRAKDSLGHTGQFVPLGMPPAVVNGNVDINLNGVKVGSFTEVGATVSLYPIIQLLKKSGLDVGWNGKTLTVNSPLIPTAKLPPVSGQGPYSIVVNGQPVLNTTGMVMKDSYTHKDTTYLSADVVGFLVDFLGHGNPQVASFTGYEFNFNTAPASTSAGK